MKHTYLNTHLLSRRTRAVENLEMPNLLTANSGPHFQGRCFCQDRDLALHQNTQGQDKAFDAGTFPLPPTLNKSHRHCGTQDCVTRSQICPLGNEIPQKPFTKAIGKNVAKWTMNLCNQDSAEKSERRVEVSSESWAQENKLQLALFLAVSK